MVGILLCVSTHDGNHLVFHYPPKPGYFGYRPVPLPTNSSDRTKTYDEAGSNASSSSSSEDDEDFKNKAKSEDEDDADSDDDDKDNGYEDGEGYYTRNSRSKENPDLKTDLQKDSSRDSQTAPRDSISLRPGSIVSGTSSHHGSFPVTTEGSGSLKSSPVFGSSSIVSSKQQSQQQQRQPPHVHRVRKLFGFNVDFISEMVSPPKALCNNRFELTVEDMVFLGLPIHIGDDGNWRPTHHHHHHHKKSSKHRHTKSYTTSDTSTSGAIDDGDDEIEAEEKDKDKLEEDIEDEETNEEDQHTTHQSSLDCPMYMFNLVFVMNPPVDEYNYRIDQMYHYVISRMTLLLRYEQQKTNYVWEESKKILKLREEAMSLGLGVKKQWNYIVEKSSLANVIRQTYEAMRNSDIVNVEINAKFSSFQIPIKTEFNTVPPKNIRVLPGSSLSSISPFNNMMTDPVNYPGSQPDSDNCMVYFALLLLDDSETIIRDIKAEKDSLIANFIRMIKPTENLMRLSTLSGLDITEVKLFASHLVYWRRAKATLPLAPRNIYIVSPLAPMDQMYKDSVLFRVNFPNLPSLSNFLSLISTNSNRPRPVSTIIPSRDHRDLYMEAVSWLLKYGYLTQLYTFLWLCISKEIKIRVAEELETEKKRRQSMKKKENKQKKLSETTNGGDESALATSGESSETNENEEGGKVRNTDNTTKEGTLAEKGAPHRNLGEEGTTRANVSREFSAESITGQSEASNDNRGFKKKVMVQFEEEEEEDTILTDPESATALERRWIAKCVEGKPTEVVNLFYRLLKYMNGKNPLELIILRENVSRQDVRKMLGTVDRVVTVRHW
ncbi:hypothetical protein FOA43_001910 [Brettanomyces nanus]|uniref:Nitrogen permease regulator 3 n=1 Tax=Eeniella nana TaxID=13502 RepID=A0A875S477_EENNA|nr:uncharacterized protein FOA43_001910 [Brettanomyces nanus]QPG74579.1 hypothetical protein FOA43_001910 [Brettanomyces nanus]